jgi:hypothetical protein
LRGGIRIRFFLIQKHCPMSEANGIHSLPAFQPTPSPRRNSVGTHYSLSWKKLFKLFTQKSTFSPDSSRPGLNFDKIAPHRSRPDGLGSGSAGQAFSIAILWSFRRFLLPSICVIIE